MLAAALQRRGRHDVVLPRGRALALAAAGAALPAGALLKRVAGEELDGVGRARAQPEAEAAGHHVGDVNRQVHLRRSHQPNRRLALRAALRRRALAGRPRGAKERERAGGGGGGAWRPVSHDAKALNNAVPALLVHLCAVGEGREARAAAYQRRFSTREGAREGPSLAPQWQQGFQ
jgi:hypothetical protein